MLTTLYQLIYHYQSGILYKFRTYRIKKKHGFRALDIDQLQ